MTYKFTSTIRLLRKGYGNKSDFPIQTVCFPEVHLLSGKAACLLKFSVHSAHLFSRYLSTHNVSSTRRGDDYAYNNTKTAMVVDVLGDSPSLQGSRLSNGSVVVHDNLQK